jgi:hypothetical protein
LARHLTTLYLQFEKEAEAALGLPPNVHSYALLPIGYPMGRFGPVRRIALANAVYKEGWDQPYGAAPSGHLVLPPILPFSSAMMLIERYRPAPRGGSHLSSSWPCGYLTADLRRRSGRFCRRIPDLADISHPALP